VVDVNTPRNRAADADRPTVRTRARPPLAAVRRVTDERAYLYELIQTIGAGPDLEAILRGVVRLVTEATGCHACFVYFLVDDTLVLRAASQMYEHLEGTVRIPSGEGLTGWVARTRRSAFIKERALDDSRVRRAWFPELEDEVYQSLVSVPIFSRAGEVLGVITLHAEAPHEFGRVDLDFLEHTASLIGGAVENARLFEETSARVGILRSLASVSERIASASDRDDVLTAVTEGVRELLGATAVEVHLLDPDGRPSLARSGPPSGDTQRTRFERMATAWSIDEGWLHDARRAARARWEDEDGFLLFVPLVVGDERLGLIAVLLPEAVPDAELALANVAAHAAVGLKQHEVVERLREESALRDLFRELASEHASSQEVSRLARRLDVDLDGEHLVLVAEAEQGQSTWQPLADRIERRLVARFPGALVDLQERSLRSILPVVGESAGELLERVRATDWALDDAASVGVSSPCAGAASFARGFEEATAAARVGGLLRGAGTVSSYEDLGPYRYVLAQEGRIRDAAQDRIEELRAYDARRGTELLDTLDSYLDHRGNVVATSRALFIHANTLRQRLERIQRVAGVDLEREDWLSLSVATKVVKLRRIRRANGPEGGRDG